MKDWGAIKKHKKVKTLASGSDGGRFSVRVNGNNFFIVASDGMDWDHVSVSLRDRCPTWEELCIIKDIFFNAEETVVQFHPKKSEYVNNYPYCLHMWRYQKEEHLLPPSILTGFK